ncbi:MAG: LysM peptidoglycan-binding domain-containing protein [Planctomycetota bacterium]|jgi:nucleoid-associated protein YgaU
MGSFEKLGILVIVVIIVMILAVAIHQWGATGVEIIPETVPVLGDPETLIVDFDEPLKDPAKRSGKGGATRPPAPDSAKQWPGGVPKRYRIKDRDILWKLVVKQWGLRESFIDAIKTANPRIDDVARLKAGDSLVIPDPTGYRKTDKKTPKNGTSRWYEIQEGDNLETIARNNLGDKRRWKEIQKLNPSLKPKNLKLGVKIRLPLR